MAFDFRKSHPRISLPVGQKRASPFNAFRARPSIQEDDELSSFDDTFDDTDIPFRRLQWKQRPSRLATARSYSTISSHFTVASTSTSSSYSEPETPEPHTPSSSYESFQDHDIQHPPTPLSASRPSSRHVASRPSFDFSPLKPKRRADYGRRSEDSARSEQLEEDLNRLPAYTPESPIRRRRPLPVPPQSPPVPNRTSSVPRPLPVPASPPPYSYLPPPNHIPVRRSIRPLPRPPPLPPPQPETLPSSRPDSPASTIMPSSLDPEPWQSAEDARCQASASDVIDWDVIEEIMLYGDDDHSDSDSTNLERYL